MSFLQGPADFWETVAKSSPAASIGKGKKTDGEPASQTLAPPRVDTSLETYLREEKRKRGLAQVSSGRGTNSYPTSGFGSSLIG